MDPEPALMRWQREKIPTLMGIEPPDVFHIASHVTDLAVLAHYYVL
jgi:hypothetical protein